MVYCATALVRPAAVVDSSGSSMMLEVVIHPDDAMAADINPQYSEYLPTRLIGHELALVGKIALPIALAR